MAHPHIRLPRPRIGQLDRPLGQRVVPLGDPAPGKIVSRDGPNGKEENPQTGSAARADLRDRGDTLITAIMQLGVGRAPLANPDGTEVQVNPLSRITLLANLPNAMTCHNATVRNYLSSHESWLNISANLRNWL
jgi:hypothetical protein